MTNAKAAPPIHEQLLTVPLDKLVPSDLNPREAYPPDGLRELGESLVAGQLTPLLVRAHKKRPGHYEIAAGHRRLLAARAANLDALWCRVFAPVDDAAFLEALTSEQVQHEDFTPLEEAQSYKNLQTVGKLDVAQIAGRVKKEERYIRDRLRLLELIQRLQKALRDGEITLEHAIILARLKPTDQKKVHDFGLFQALPFFDGPSERKAVSPRELQRWIDANIRFRVEDAPVDLFPATLEKVKAATEAQQKVVPITLEHALKDGAKDKERTYTVRSWKPTKGKPCEHQVLGVFVAGQQRGEAIEVCLERKKCATHWPEEVRAAKREGTAKASNDREAMAKADAKRKEEEAAREREVAKWVAAAPAVCSAIVQKIGKLSSAQLVKHATDGLEAEGYGKEGIQSLLPAKDPRRALELVVAHELVGRLFGSWHLQHQLPRIAKTFGVDVKPLLTAAERSLEPKPAAAPKAKAPRKPKAKK